MADLATHNGGNNMAVFTSRVYELTHAIPVGRVTTYKHIAIMSGFPNHSRHVGNAMRDLPPNSTVPWQIIDRWDRWNIDVRLALAELGDQDRGSLTNKPSTRFALTMAEKQISLTDLNSGQLQEVKRQLEEEIEHLSGSFGSLRSAQAKYRSCANDVEEMKPSTKGKSMLVPLTSSLYVPGRITDPEHVVVDIGTGYYVKKSRQEAISLYTSKVKFVQENLDKLQATIERKQDNLQSCVGILQMKMQEERQAGVST